MPRKDHSALGVLSDVVGLVLGLVVAFSGYRLLKALAGFAGFLVGFAVGLSLGTVFTFNPLVGLVVGLVLGILLALLFTFAFRLVGAVLGGVLGATLAAALGLGGLLTALLVVAGVVLGLVANKALIVVGTAANGAWLAAASGVSLLDAMGARFDKDDLVTLGAALVLAVLGMAVQFRSLRGER